MTQIKVLDAFKLNSSPQSYEVSIALRICCGILLTIKTINKHFVNFSETCFQIDDSKVESYTSIFCNFLSDALPVLTLPIH